MEIFNGLREIGLFILLAGVILRKRKFKGFIEYESFKMGIEAED